jgi:diadenosine tetraphosphate (Ap4A) HIT family hydrolase
MFASAAIVVCALAARAETPCGCDPKVPETMKERQCSLCAEAEKQPPDAMIFFLRDANPRKPNRLLALPRQHSTGLQRITDLAPDVRQALWREAIAKARVQWGDDWGVAYNGDRVRTQCHVHVHIGKMIPGVEWGDFVMANGPDDIPVPAADGLWIHPIAGGKLHVHTGEQVTENVLLR